MNQLINSSVVRITIFYALASALWVFASDRFLGMIIRDPLVLTSLQTYKGWLFVFISSVFLFVLLVGEKVGRWKAETALEKSQESFQRLFSNNPYPMWVFDPATLMYLDVNETAIEKYGYSRDDFQRMTISDIQQPEDTEVAAKTANSKEPIQLTGIQHHITKNGQLITVNLVSHTFEFSNNPAVLVIVEDVTQRTAVETAYLDAETKRITAEQMLSLDESRLEALLKLSQMEDASQEDMVKFALGEAVYLTYSDQGYLVFLDEQDLPRETFIWNRENSSLNKINIAIKPGQLDIEIVLTKVVRSGKPLLLNDRETEREAYQGGSFGYPFTRHMMVPIHEKDRVTVVVGVLGKDHPYNNADLRQLTLLIGGLYRAIKNNQMIHELRESQLRLKTAVENLPFDFYMYDQGGRFIIQNEISRQMWGTLLGKTEKDIDLPEELRSFWSGTNRRALSGEVVHQEVVYPGREHLGTFFNIVAPIRDHGEPRGILGININITDLKQRERELEAIVKIASALRRTTAREKLLPIILDHVMDVLGSDRAAQVSFLPDSQELVVELGRGEWSHFTGTVHNGAGGVTEKVVTTGESFQSEDINALPDLKARELFENVPSGACVPLIADELTMGAIWVGGRKPFSDGDLNVLKAIADIAANGIHRAVLYEQTSRQLQRLTALRAIDMAITSTLDVRVTLDILLNQVTSQVGADAAGVFLYQPHLQLLELCANRGFRTESPKGTLLHLGEGIAGKVALERKPRLITDLQAIQTPLTDLLREQKEFFRGYLALPLIAKGQIKGVLEIFNHDVLNPTNDWLEFVQAIASQAAITIDNAELFDQLQSSNIDLMMAYESTIEGWSRALELRDQETEGHTQRVTELTMKLIKDIGISDEDAIHIRRGVLLHDIGKMGIPDHILMKPGPLSEEEWKIMRKHPEYAYGLLSRIPYLQSSVDIPYSHHERWDGKGYPRGLKGDEIPLPARVFSVVDNWDALTSDRPYRKAWPDHQVREYLLDQAGRRFDPEIVAFFLERIHAETNTSA